MIKVFPTGQMKKDYFNNYGTNGIPSLAEELQVNRDSPNQIQ